jgi:hypothetical protein
MDRNIGLGNVQVTAIFLLPFHMNLREQSLLRKSRPKCMQKVVLKTHKFSILILNRTNFRLDMESDHAHRSIRDSTLPELGAW